MDYAQLFLSEANKKEIDGLTKMVEKNIKTFSKPLKLVEGILKKSLIVMITDINEICTETGWKREEVLHLLGIIMKMNEPKVVVKD